MENNYHILANINPNKLHSLQNDLVNQQELILNQLREVYLIKLINFFSIALDSHNVVFDIEQSGEDIFYSIVKVDSNNSDIKFNNTETLIFDTIHSMFSNQNLISIISNMNNNFTLNKSNYVEVLATNILGKDLGKEWLVFNEYSHLLNTIPEANQSNKKKKI